MDMDIILVAMRKAIWGIMICKFTKIQRKFDLMGEVPFHCFARLHKKRIDYLTTSTMKYILIWITQSLKP